MRLFCLLAWSILLGCRAQTLQRYDLPEAQARLALCNDGSPAIYYSDAALPTTPGAKILVYLQGGGFCNSAAACAQRLVDNPELASTTAYSWPSTLSPDTVLLSDATLNPGFYDYIHVFVPYCSSDIWQVLWWTSVFLSCSRRCWWGFFPLYFCSCWSLGPSGSHFLGCGPLSL